MNTTFGSNKMCNVKPPINMNNGKDVILVWDILELILFCTMMQGLYPVAKSK
jgi:hypothetical protein